jgi:uncharacterized protein (UPF0276 family)
MQLAVNWSPEAAALVDERRIELDVFKCPDWPEMIADAKKQRPVYVHFPLIAGAHNLEKVGVANIERWLAETDTQYVNMHLGVRNAQYDMDDPAVGEKMLDDMLGDIHQVAAQFGAERVILENLYWDERYDIARPVVEASFIRRIVEESGCGFLLDLAHAQVAAQQLGLDARAYVERLPVERLRELHITGLEFDDQYQHNQDHYAMHEPDWVMAEWAMERIHSGAWGQPWGVALEYGGIGSNFNWRSKAEVLAVDVPRLYALAHPKIVMSNEG